MNRRPWYAVLVTVVVLGTASTVSPPTAPSPSGATPAPAPAASGVTRLAGSLDVAGLVVSGILTLCLISLMRRRARPVPTQSRDRPLGPSRPRAPAPRPADQSEGLAQLARRTGLAQDALRLLSSQSRRGRVIMERSDSQTGKIDRSGRSGHRRGPTPELVAALVVSPRLRASDRPAHGLPIDSSS